MSRLSAYFNALPRLLLRELYLLSDVGILASAVEFVLYRALFFLNFFLIMCSLRLIFLSLSISAQGAAALAINMTLGQDSTPHQIVKQGWTSQPDGRGTLDIVWSCVLTFSLCSWNILCLNIPSRSESTILVLWRKTCLAGLGVMCPEILCAIAFGQWLSARQNVRDFNTTAHSSKWGMKEAFFSDMGGFLLQSEEECDFPLDAKQLYFLVSRGYLPLPDLDRREIEERNKVDILLRIITVGQVLWFLINVTGRWAQHLVVTTAELTTVSFILCSLATIFFWWHKPADAKIGKVIEKRVSIADIFWKENRGVYSNDDWKLTPLDFVNRNEWWWARLWTNWLNILRRMHLTFGSNKRPIDRIADSLQKELGNQPMLITTGSAACFFSVFFLAWNSSFPTHVEQILWRAACLLMMGTLVSLTIGVYVWATPAMKLLVERSFSSKSPLPSKVEGDFESKIWTRSKNMINKIDRWCECIRNNSVDKDPQLRTPLKLLLPMTLIGALYCCTRLYIIVADIIELRSLPASAYATVDWMKFLPHLG